jgi:hypothetical protein
MKLSADELSNSTDRIILNNKLNNLNN